MADLRKSLALSFAQKYSVTVIQIVSTVILARILTPEEIGIYSVGIAIVGMAHLLRDFGIGPYLIQEKVLTDDKIRSAFTVTLIISWAVGLMIFLLGTPLAEFYRQPGVKQVTTIVSLNFLLLPFGSPILALLNREMKFFELYVINVSSSLFSTILTITLAFYGFGFTSLAWGSVSGVVVTILLAAVYRPEAACMLPGLKSWRAVISFGSKMSVITIVGEIADRMPELAAGRFLGFAPVGIYSRAEGAVNIFSRTIMHSIAPVFMPHIAGKHRNGEDILGPYLRAVTCTTGLSWPFFLFLGIMAYPVIQIMYGDQWTAAVPLVQILCIKCFLEGLIYFFRPTLIAIQRLDDFFKLDLVIQPLRILLFILAATHSLEAIAIVAIVAPVLHIGCSCYFLGKSLGLRALDLLWSVRSSFAVAVLSGIGPMAIMETFDLSDLKGLWIALLAAIASSFLGWVAGLWVFRHPLMKELSKAFQSTKSAIQRR